MAAYPQGRFVQQSASSASNRLASLTIAEEKAPFVVETFLGDCGLAAGAPVLFRNIG